LKFLSIFLFIFILSTNAISQEEYDQSFYFELLGNAGLYSFNYEHNIYNSINGRIGISYIPSFGVGNMITSPLIISYYGQKNNITPEIGLGFLFGHIYGNSSTNRPMFDDNNNTTKTKALFTATIGLRFYKNDNVYRLTYTPILSHDHSYILHLGGLSFGIRF